MITYLKHIFDSGAEMSELMAVYGAHTVSQLLQTQRKRVQRLWLLEGKLSPAQSEIQLLAKKHGITVQRANQQKFLSEISEDAVHQGVIAFCHPLPHLHEKDLSTLIERKRATGERFLALILDGVQDPRNLGACVRSAAAYAVDVVIVPKDKSAKMTASAEKVACGGAALVPLLTVTNLARCMRVLQADGVWLVGLDGNTQLAIQDVDLCRDIALVMGSEGRGMRALTSKNCDHIAQIPMSGHVSSLNVSAAASIALYEHKRQNSC